MFGIELKDTIVPMCSANYKDRFVAEYIQLKVRYEKLKAFNTRIKAAVLSLGGDGEVAMPEHDCPDELLREQQKLMGELLHVLEVRAVIEGIDLQGCMKMLSKNAREREEDKRERISLSECKDDGDVLTEAFRRCIFSGVTTDEEDARIFEAASNLLLKVRELEKPCKACKTEERDVEAPSPTGEELPEGLLSLEETIKIFEICMESTDESCDGCPIYDTDCKDELNKNALYYLKKYAESK